MVSAKSPVGACAVRRECLPYGRRIGYCLQEAADEQVQDGVRQGHEEAEGEILDRLESVDMACSTARRVLKASAAPCVLMLLYIVKGFGVLGWLVRGGDGLDPECGATFEFG